MTRIAVVLLVLIIAGPLDAAGPRAGKPAATKPAATTPGGANAALLALVDVERQSKQYYGAVLDKHRPLHPFAMVYRAERKHEQALLEELKRNGIAAPAEPRAAKAVAAPDDTARATAKAVKMEKRTVAAYDAALKVTTDPATRATLARLRAESVDHQRWFEDPDSCPMRGGRGWRGGRGASGNGR